MRVDVTLYKDEFNTHKQLNAVLLEEVLRRHPRKPDVDETELDEIRSALLDTLFDEATTALDEFFKPHLNHTVLIKFEDKIIIEPVQL